MDKKIRLVLIASGSGTDAASIMKSWREGFLPEVEIVGLISTKEGAGCLERASGFGVETHVVSSKLAEEKGFGERMYSRLHELNPDLIFLVGCNKYISPTRDMYNIHPADPMKHGGQGMYGLKVHEHVLTSVLDVISRGMKNEYDSFYTYPTVHEASEKYDQGHILLQAAITIPSGIIFDLLLKRRNSTQAAEMLQKHVLPYEWLMLPTAVRIAAKKILDERG